MINFIDEHDWRILTPDYILSGDMVYQQLLLRDHIRVESFKKALEENIQEGTRVLDLGSGMGLLSFFAAKAGAYVTAIEYDSRLVHMAEKIAKGNKLDGRIKFVQGLSTEIDQNSIEPVDVIVSETLGVMGIGENIVRYISGARDKWLKLGGVVIPSKIELYLALAYCHDLEPYLIKVKSEFGEYLGESAANRTVDVLLEYPMFGHVRKEWIASDPVNICTVDLSQETDLLIDKVVEFMASKRTQINGVVGWFNACLSPNIILRTSPYDTITHWHQIFYPIKEACVDNGAKIQVRVVAEENEGYVALNVNI